MMIWCKEFMAWAAWIIFHADTHDDNFENYLSSKKNNPCVVIVIGEQNTWWRIHTINFDSFFQISLMEENYKKS